MLVMERVCSVVFRVLTPEEGVSRLKKRASRCPARRTKKRRRAEKTKRYIFVGCREYVYVSYGESLFRSI